MEMNDRMMMRGGGGGGRGGEEGFGENSNQDFSQKSSSKQGHHYSRTIFVGDLSYYCTEEHLYQHFQSFGPIELAQLKTSKDGKPHLSYGFVKYHDSESAAAAIEAMDGKVMLGRAIRVGWASDNPSKKPLRQRKRGEKVRTEPTAQVHVGFNTRDPRVLITEDSLRELYSQFGELVDVTIKKIVTDRAQGVQSGYGFVHYPLTRSGVASAYHAVTSTNQVLIGSVQYDCGFSHGLQDYLASLVDNDKMRLELFPGGVSPFPLVPTAPSPTNSSYTSHSHSSHPPNGPYSAPSLIVPTTIMQAPPQPPQQMPIYTVYGPPTNLPAMMPPHSSMMVSSYHRSVMPTMSAPPTGRMYQAPPTMYAPVMAQPRPHISPTGYPYQGMDPRNHPPHPPY